MSCILYSLVLNLWRKYLSSFDICWFKSDRFLVNDFDFIGSKLEHKITEILPFKASSFCSFVFCHFTWWDHNYFCLPKYLYFIVIDNLLVFMICIIKIGSMNFVVLSSASSFVSGSCFVLERANSSFKIWPSFCFCI